MSRPTHQFPSGYNPTVTTQSSAPDISAILSVITQNQTQSRTNPQAVQQQSAPEATTSELEAIFAQHAIKNQQMPQAHMPQAHLPQMQMPQMQMPQSLQPSQHPATTFDLQSSLAALQTPNQAQPAYNQAALLQIPDLRGLLSQFAQQAPAPTPAQNYAYNTGYQNAENERKRQLDYDEPSNRDYQSKGKRQKSEGKKKV